MHALVSRTKYALFHGHNNSGDFVEVPSVMLEHWCFTPGPLKRMSAHRETGEPVPEIFISQVMRTQYCTRIHTQFQVALAAFDQAIYGPASQQEIEEMDVAKLYSDILYQKTGFTGVER
jgi:Zn-dependent oligopeptidase